MKKYIMPGLLILLLVLQLVSLNRINVLQNNLQNTHNQLSSHISSQSGQINGMYARIEGLLDRQASLVEQFDVSFGPLDQETLTVPATVTVLAKEVRTDARAILHVETQQITMSRSGPAYTATLPVDLFTTFRPVFVLTEAGVEKAEVLTVMHNLQSSLLPHVFAHFQSAGGPGYRWDAAAERGTYNWKGQIYFEVKPAQNNTIESVRYIVDLDGTILTDRQIGTEELRLSVDESVELKVGQTLTFLIRGIDSYGLIHQIVLQRIQLSADGDPVFDEWAWMDTATIMTEFGDILYQPR